MLNERLTSRKIANQRIYELDKKYTNEGERVQKLANSNEGQLNLPDMCRALDRTRCRRCSRCGSFLVSH